MNRSATIICKEDCHFAVLDSQSYNEIFMESHKKTLNSKIEIFRSIPLFSKMMKSTLTKLLYFFEYRKYSAGSYVYKKGNIAQNVFIIFSGEFEVNFRRNTPILSRI